MTPECYGLYAEMMGVTPIMLMVAIRNRLTQHHFPEEGMSLCDWFKRPPPPNPARREELGNIQEKYLFGAIELKKIVHIDTDSNGRFLTEADRYCNATTPISAI